MKKIPIVDNKPNSLSAELSADEAGIEASEVYDLRDPIGMVLGFTRQLLGKVPEESLDYEELKIIEHECIHCQEMFEDSGELKPSEARKLNSPIGIILGFTQRLLGRAPAGSLDQEELKIIEKECIRCGKIIKDLLDLARPGIPQKRLLHEAELREIISSFLDLLKFKITKSKIQVRLNLASGSMIEIDRSQFKQVLINIILNAVQAMPNGGDLHISVSTQTSHAKYPDGLSRVVITDTALGNVLPIYSPFFEEQNKAELRLAIAKKIIEAHGGTIKVETEIGKGTKVILELPLQRSCHEKDPRCG